MIKIILEHVNAIVNCHKAFSAGEKFEFLHSTKQQGNIDRDECIQLGYHCFIHRLGYAGRSIETILSAVRVGDNLRSVEFSVGILLRPCLLDCLMIFAWVKNHDLISALASESFERLPANKYVSKEIIDEYKEFGKYLNFMNYKGKDLKITTERLVDQLEGDDYAQALQTLYSRFSKYDHFSPFPFMRETTDVLFLKDVEFILIIIKLAMKVLFENFELNGEKVVLYKKNLNLD